MKGNHSWHILTRFGGIWFKRVGLANLEFSNLRYRKGFSGEGLVPPRTSKISFLAFNRDSPSYNPGRLVAYDSRFYGGLHVFPKFVFSKCKPSDFKYRFYWAALAIFGVSGCCNDPTDINITREKWWMILLISIPAVRI